MKVSKTAVLVLFALTCGAAMAAEPSSSVKLYGVLDTGVYAHHASSGQTVVEMASGITKGSRFGLEGQENLPFSTPEQQDGGIEPPPVLSSRFFRFLNLP